MSALTQAMQEYANAIRGDWSNFDGRTERNVIEAWIGEINNPTDKTIEEWRADLQLCADGSGHWHGIMWGNCYASTCPTAVREYNEWAVRQGKPTM